MNRIIENCGIAVGNVPILRSSVGWIRAYPDCMQTGMHARGALIPHKRQRRNDCGLETGKKVLKPALMATNEDGIDRSQGQEEPHHLQWWEYVSLYDTGFVYGV